MFATIFDFNGVLVDDEHVHLAAFRDVLAPLGVTVSDEAYVERYLGSDDEGALRAILEDAGRASTDAEIAALVEAKKPVYMKRIEAELRVFPGAVDLVRRRADKGPVGVVSGALRHEIEHALGVMGLRSAVGFIVSADDTTCSKPDPEGYLLGVRALEARGHRGPVVVVEDSLSGVEAAKAAGLFCAAVAHSYSRERLVEAGADVVVATLAELTDALLDR